MQPRTVSLTLEAAINRDNQLIVRMTDDSGRERPFTSIAELAGDSPGADQVTMRIHDFHQDNTSYRVYGITRQQGGDAASAHWHANDTGDGRWYTFALAGADIDSFVIGATPDTPGASEPAPFECQFADVSADMDFPIPIDPPKKGS